VVLYNTKGVINIYIYIWNHVREVFSFRVRAMFKFSFDFNNK